MMKLDYKILAPKSFIFSDNSVGTTWLYYYQSTPQVLVLEQSDPESDGFYDRNMLIFSNCYFINNYSPEKGGAINYGNLRFTALTTVRFLNCKFIKNRASKGGAISLHLYDGCMIEDCDFIENSADQTGSGAIFIETQFKCKNKNMNGELDMPQGLNPIIQILKCRFKHHLVFEKCNFTILLV